mmetsp:Transcript_32796/g.79456  ORF Transcript_32796/g.79456 Transcript_32796/m.79456 type:complete len:350 (-) Transcript_32796:640-1689(-)
MGMRSGVGVVRPGSVGALLAACALAGALGSGLDPIVDTIQPVNGPTKGGTIITIGGTNFGSADSNIQPRVTVGGVACPSVVWVSQSSVLCETPDGVGADRTVVVEVGSRQSAPSAQSKFRYDSPKVLGIEPAHGPAKGGTMVTVAGVNFGETNSNPSVTVGGRPCQSVVWLSDKKLTCVTPSGTGVGDVRVFVLDESSPENFGTVFEFDAPVIASLKPDHGSCAGKFTITVKGKKLWLLRQPPQDHPGGRRVREVGVGVGRGGDVRRSQGVGEREAGGGGDSWAEVPHRPPLCVQLRWPPHRPPLPPQRAHDGRDRGDDRGAELRGEGGGLGYERQGGERTVLLCPVGE